MKSAARSRIDDSNLPDDPRLVEAVRAYQTAWETGRRPERRPFLEQHPDLAEAITACFDGLDLVHGLGLTASGDPNKTLPPLPSQEEIRPEDPLGDFRLVREIGRGGMGIVYEAVQLSLGRRVAVKVLPFAAALDTRNLQRFKNEAQAAAQLHHTNIVPVYAVGCERGVHFYAMQIIDGQSISVALEGLRKQAQQDTEPTITAKARAQTRTELNGAFSTQASVRTRDYFRVVARLGVQAARALDHAHEFGVVHRDIKPGNLLIDGRGNLWITDFGLAQFHAEAHVTASGDLIGTLRYMSPEQAGGGRGLIDHRTDIYSLGATLYELLTLEPIFAGESRAGLLAQILHDEPSPPRVWNGAIPVEMETIILKAIAKNPAERYATAGELADDLQRFLDDQPIRARRPSLWDRTRKWARRHPSVVWAGAILLVLGIVGLCINNWMVEAERAQTARAWENEKKRAEEAENRFQQAKRSIDFIIQVCEQELADQPHMHSLRRKLLDFALVHYQDFLDQRGDADQAELAATQARVKTILSELDLLQGAQRFFHLNERAVQDDMSLSNEQRENLDKLSRPWPDMDSPFFGGKSSHQERHKKFVEWARQREQAVAQVLKRDQIERLGQIALQRKGPGAFNEPEVIAQLKLSREQQEKIREAQQPMFVKFESKGPPPDKEPPDGKAQPKGKGPKGPPRFDFLEQWTKVSMERILAALTEDQRAEWGRMTGPLAPAPDFRWPWKGKVGPG